MNVNKNISLALILVVLEISVCWAGSVYRLTNNNRLHHSPKLVITSAGHIYCFWKEFSNNSDIVQYRYFDGNQWSTISTIDTMSSGLGYNYDVDVDSLDQLWYVAGADSEFRLFSKKPLEQEFVRRAVYSDSSIFEEPIFTISVSALDSANVWIDADNLYYIPNEAHDYALFNYNGHGIQKIDTTLSGGAFCDGSIFPRRAVESSQSKIYLLKNGYFDCHGNPTEYVTRVYNRDPDPAIPLNLNTVTDFRVWDYPPGSQVTASGMIGVDLDGFIMFFQQIAIDSVYDRKIKAIEPFADQVVRTWDHVNFYPTTVSKSKNYIAMGWITNNNIAIKAVDDSTFFRTKIIRNDSLPESSDRHNLQIVADDFPNVWFAWRGTHLGQTDIFVANWAVSTVIDTSIITSIHSPADRFNKSDDIDNILIFPNPFNSMVTIQLNVRRPGTCQINVFNILGEEIKEVYRGSLPGGEVRFSWPHEGQDFIPSGIYLIRIKTENNIHVRKVLVLR